MYRETMFYLLEAIGHGVLIGYNVVNLPVVFLQVNGASTCLLYLSSTQPCTSVLNFNNCSILMYCFLKIG